MEDITRIANVSKLVQFSQECNEILATAKPTRAAKRRLEAYRRPLTAMKSDERLGAIAYNRLAVLDAVIHYATSGSELSRHKSIKLHTEGDKLVESLAAQYKAGGS